MMRKPSSFRLGLAKTRSSLLGRINDVLKRGGIREDLWENLEEVLIQADLGVQTSIKILDSVRERVKKSDQDGVILDCLQQEILNSLLSEGRELNISPDSSPTVILVAGINGVGKTTTVAKLAYRFKSMGKKVLLAAGDTFRAAAIEQLSIWSKKIGVDVVKHNYGADSAAVAYDAAEAARARGVHFLLIDTAGRSHTKTNLMKELGKIKNVLQANFSPAPQEVLLVLDATTGQNALSQAKMFTESLGVTGIVLAKIDGTAKGGIIVAIENELQLPVKFIGVGEDMTDLVIFDPQAFATSLFEL